MADVKTKVTFAQSDDFTDIAEVISYQLFFFNIWNNQSHLTQHPKSFLKKKKSHFLPYFELDFTFQTSQWYPLFFGARV